MLLFIGLSHRHAPLQVRERCAVPADDRERVALELGRKLGPLVLLSTCGRTELYLDHADPDAAEQLALAWFARHTGLPLDQLEPHLELARGEAALRRLVRVACGVESALEGENEILGQTRRAWLDAAVAGLLSPELDAAFRLAVRTGRQVRRLGDPRAWTSLADSAVARVELAIAGLARPRVLVAGTGPMGLHTAEALRAHFGHELRLALLGRTPARVAPHAQRLGARALGLDDLAATLDWADAAVIGLRTPRALIGPADLPPRQAGRPLLLIDLSVPRAVENAVGLSPDICLRNVDDLGGLGGRWDAAARARVDALIELALAARAAGQPDAANRLPALRMQAESIRKAQLERTMRRLPQLDSTSRHAIDALTRAIVNRLLHEPTQRLKADPTSEPAQQFLDVFGIAGRAPQEAGVRTAV